MFKKVEMIEKKFEKFEKEIKEMLKNKLVSTQFVEEFVIDVKYVNAGAERMMLIDSGAPESIVSKKWFAEYFREPKVNEDEIKRKKCARRFRMGKTVYLSEEEVVFPVVMKTDKGDFMKREVVASRLGSGELFMWKGNNKKMED